jgi:hypothetical protein
MCVNIHFLELTTFHFENTDVSGGKRTLRPVETSVKTSPLVAERCPIRGIYSHSWLQQNTFSFRLLETDPLKRSHFVFPFPWIYYLPGSFPFFGGRRDLTAPSNVCGFVLWEEEITSSETRKVLLGQTLQEIHQIWFVASHFTWNLYFFSSLSTSEPKVLISYVKSELGK